MPPRDPNPEFPVTVLIDSKEQLPFIFADINDDGTETIDGQWRVPYAFDAVPADKEHGGGFWRVRTERLNLPTGDYSLDGYATAVAVERKSKADLFGTLGQGRGRFVRELERLDAMTFAAVVVEAEWSEILADPPAFSRLDPKTVFRSVLAWQQRFPRVHWLMMPGREAAEVTTFRVLERWVKEQAENSFRKPRKVNS